LPGFAAGTNYLPYDMAINAHEGERIMPAADNRLLMATLQNPQANNAVLVAAIEAQRKDNAEMAKRLDAALYAIAKYTQATANSLDDSINGGKPIQTLAVPA
jgi:hypothetical protein